MSMVTKASRIACCSGMCIYERPEDDCPAEDRHGDGAAAMLDALAFPTPEMELAGARSLRDTIHADNQIVRARAVWFAMLAEARK